MSTRLSPEELDEILALQFTVAWAGESAGEPARLGWWNSDLVDPEGGGDLWKRLVPKTAPWASLALVRAAARRVDEAARAKLAGGDRMWTLFHFGFPVDEQLDDRLAYHRQHGHVPSEVLGSRFIVGKPWSKAAFEGLLTELGSPKAKKTERGRELEAKPSTPVEAAPMLAAALLPLPSPAAYPLPLAEIPA